MQEVLLNLQDFRKKTEAVNRPPLESPVRGPQGCCATGLEGEHRPARAAAAWGDCAGEFSKGFRGEGFWAILDGKFSKTIISVMPYALLRLKNFRKPLNTFKTHARVSLASC